MSTPPITQKNALLALASAASNAATVSALVTQPEQLCSSGVRTCISANPPPVTGWIRCWVGKASIQPVTGGGFAGLQRPGGELQEGERPPREGPDRRRLDHRPASAGQGGHSAP